MFLVKGANQLKTKTHGLTSDTNKTRDPKYMKKLAEEYGRTGDVATIAYREHINSATLYYHFKKYGVSKGHFRAHTLDEHYFDTINTFAKAYILGFITADGFVCKTSEGNFDANRLVINISHKDRAVLEFIKDEFQCDYEIIDYIPDDATYGSSMMSKLVVNSIHMCKSLAKLGITPRKTGFEYIPKMNKKFFGSFIRGFFDGDGSVYYRDGGKYKTISFISASKDMLTQIELLLQNNCGVQTMPTFCKNGFRKDGTVKKGWSIRYNKTAEVATIAKYMYQHNDFCLERKHLRLI